MGPIIERDAGDCHAVSDYAGGIGAAGIVPMVGRSMSAFRCIFTEVVVTSLWQRLLIEPILERVCEICPSRFPRPRNPFLEETCHGAVGIPGNFGVRGRGRERASAAHLLVRSRLHRHIKLSGSGVPAWGTETRSLVVETPF